MNRRSPAQNIVRCGVERHRYEQYTACIAEDCADARVPRVHDDTAVTRGLKMDLFSVETALRNKDGG